MKTLFLVFYGFQEYNGISKKIRYQADALRLCGADVRTCHYEVGNDGSRKWMIDKDVLADLGKGIPAKIKNGCRSPLSCNTFAGKAYNAYISAPITTPIPLPYTS